LGEALAERGIRARGPALPGHNATPEQLARTTHAEWCAAAREHLRALRAEHERVFVVGMSMGGLLSLEVAGAEPVDAVVTVGVPLRLPRPVESLIPVLKYLRPMLPKKDGSDICDAAARERHPSYAVMPLRAVHELVRLQRRVRASLHRVTAPIYIAHGAHDRTANPDDARAIYAGVGSEVRELVIFESSGHVVPVDFDGPTLARAAADFLARYAG
jgi:carboxylesterase